MVVIRAPRKRHKVCTDLGTRALVRWSFCTLVLVGLFLDAAWASEGHNALLPQPQQIRYGPHRVRIRGLGIRLTADPTIEDRFAAGQLSQCLSDAAKEPVRVSQGETGSTLIVLKRTGEVGALPLPGEHPGPTSREAYSLKVTPGIRSLTVFEEMLRLTLSTTMVPFAPATAVLVS